MPVAEIVERLDAGQAVTGTGYTVARGRDPEPFTVEVLGVQRHFFLALGAWLVTGRNFPDALAAGPAVAVAGGVLLLVDGVRLEGSPVVGGWLAREGSVASVTVVGGRAAISDDIYRAVEDRLAEASR